MPTHINNSTETIITTTSSLNSSSMLSVTSKLVPYNSRVACAVTRGESHVKMDKPCQDSVGYLKVNDTTILAIADGLGSAEYSQEGSSSSVDLALRLLANNPKEDFNFVFRKCHEYLLKLAQQNERKPREYATTLLLGVIERHSAKFAQVGDGSIVIGSSPFEFQLLKNESNQSDSLNSTHSIVQSNYLAKIDTHEVNHEVEFVAMFSDGLESSAIVRSDNSPFTSFFIQLNKALRSKRFPDKYLSALLNCDQVKHRSDDDKSIVCWQKI